MVAKVARVQQRAGSSRLDRSHPTVVGDRSQQAIAIRPVLDALCQHLRLKGEPVIEAVAVTGNGVFETLKDVAKLVLAELKKSA